MQPASVASPLHATRPAASRPESTRQARAAFSDHLETQDAAARTAPSADAARRDATAQAQVNADATPRERPAQATGRADRAARRTDDGRTNRTDGTRRSDDDATARDEAGVAGPREGAANADAVTLRTGDAADADKGGAADEPEAGDGTEADKAALLARTETLPEAAPPVVPTDPAAADGQPVQPPAPGVATQTAGIPGGAADPAPGDAAVAAVTAEATSNARAVPGPGTPAARRTAGSSAAADGQDGTKKAGEADGDGDDATAVAAAGKDATKAMVDALKALGDDGQDKAHAPGAHAERAAPAAPAAGTIPAGEAAPKAGGAAGVQPPTDEAAAAAKAGHPGKGREGDAAVGRTEDVQVTVTTLADAAGSAPQLTTAQADLRTPQAGAAIQQPQAPVPTSQPTPLAMLPIEIGLRAMEGLQRFEIRLSPDDLGRIDVRLDIAPDGGVKAHLTVDRVDTLALLQRDARTLERAFEQAGLRTGDGGLQFSLGSDRSQGGQQNPDGGRRDATGQVATDTNDTAARDIVAALRSMGAQNGALDIRI